MPKKSGVQVPKKHVFLALIYLETNFQKQERKQAYEIFVKIFSGGEAFRNVPLGKHFMNFPTKLVLFSKLNPNFTILECSLEG